MKQYKGMNPTYFVGIQSLFDPNPAEYLEDHNNQFDGKHLRPASLSAQPAGSHMCCFFTLLINEDLYYGFRM